MNRIQMLEKRMRAVEDYLLQREEEHDGPVAAEQENVTLMEMKDDIEMQRLKKLNARLDALDLEVRREEEFKLLFGFTIGPDLRMSIIRTIEQAMQFAAIHGKFTADEMEKVREHINAIMDANGLEFDMYGKIRCWRDSV